VTAAAAAAMNGCPHRPQSSDLNNGVAADTGRQSAVTAALKIPPAVPQRNPNTALSTATKGKFTQISSTRLIGEVMKIELSKGDYYV